MIAARIATICAEQSSEHSEKQRKGCHKRAPHRMQCTNSPETMHAPPLQRKEDDIDAHKHQIHHQQTYTAAVSAIVRSKSACCAPCSSAEKGAAKVGLPGLRHSIRYESSERSPEQSVAITSASACMTLPFLHRTSSTTYSTTPGVHRSKF